MQKKDKVIVLDFDHTVFNTTLYVQALRSALEEDGVAPEVFDEKRSYLKSCCSLVDIDRFVDVLPVVDKECLHGSIHGVIKKRSHEFVFPDAQDFIDRHKGEYDIVLLTQGDQELQKEKIEHSGLMGYNDVIITKAAKDEAIAPVVGEYATVHYIDDKAKHIDEVKTAFPGVIAHFMKRPEDMPYGGIPSACDCADQVIEGLDMRIT